MNKKGREREEDKYKNKECELESMHTIDQVVHSLAHVKAKT